MNKVPKIVEKRYSYFAISLAIIILGVVLLLTVGVNFGSELTGGVELTASFTYANDNEYTEVSARIVEELEYLKLTVTSDGQKLDDGVVFTYPNKIDDKDANAEIMGYLNRFIEGSLGIDKEAAITALKPFLGETFDYANYEGINKRIPEFEIKFEIYSTSATVGAETLRQSLIALAIALAVMLVYIIVRFWNAGKFVSAFAAITALIHDVLIMTSFMIFAGWIFELQINSTFVAAVVTIVSYSINNIIVIFDRVRENQKANDTLPAEHLVNMSIRDVFKRTIFASGTTLVVVVILTILGSASIRNFTVPIMVGLLSGTYSAFFIASPLWAIFKNIGKGKEKVKPSAVKEKN